MYSIDIDLPTLLQGLQKSRHDGRIRAQLAHGFAGLSDGYAFIDMAHGRATACYLVNMQKQIILTGREAMDVISSIGVLHWLVGQENQPQTNMNLPAIRPQTSELHSTHSNPPAMRMYSPNIWQTNPQLPAIRLSAPNNPAGPHHYPFSNFVAERLIYIDSNLLGGLNRRLRRVLILVDGQRTVNKIAMVLHPSDDGQQDVFSCLQQLAKMKIISIREY